MSEVWEANLTAFKEAYDSLNAAQRDAVDSIEGPVMVIAGPGTGKTQILTLRIANILLKTDVTPENILALTFTESGAKAMRERLRRYVGAEAYRVPVFTFHGFAQKLIREYPDAYTRIIGGSPASDLQKIAILESILDTPDIKLLRPIGAPQYYISPILRIFGKLKQEYITPDALAGIIVKQEQELSGIEKIHTKGAHKGKVRGEYSKKEKAIAKNKELLHVYRRYEALLAEKNIYDFEDMIIQTIEALSKNEDMLRNLQETYQYVLADEHQDVNASQNKILELLCSYHKQPNIFVVGDEKQAIYRFQGASLENFLYFDDVFSGTKTISLTKNYRSGQDILDAAHSLVEVEDAELRKLRVPLSAEAIDQSVVERRQFTHQAVEDAWVVADIVQALEGGTPPQEIAVIVRSNREVESFAALLRKEGVAVAASADGDILQHPITHAIHNLIAAVVLNEDERALTTILHGAYWGLSVSDIFKILSARRFDRSVLDILADEECLRKLGVSDVAAAQHILDTLEQARQKEISSAPHQVLEFLLQESGFLDYVLQADVSEGARVVRRLYDEVEAMVVYDKVQSLREIYDAFAQREAYRLPLTAPYIVTNAHAVQVMTAHKSKGLEFERVYVPHLTDTRWGSAQKRTYFDIPLTKHIDAQVLDEVDDERRLLYVAMTRAKRELFLSASDTNSEGKELLPTRLFEDIKEELLKHQDTEAEEVRFDPVELLRKKPVKVGIDTQLLTDLLSQNGFSATSLNNYLKSPWDYLYRNLLRVPEVKAEHMQFGTALHGVMEQVTKYHTAHGTLPTHTQVRSLLQQQLSQLPLSAEAYTRLMEKGLESLFAYLEHIRLTLPKVTQEEVSVQVTLETGIPQLPELPLKGKLDRLDIGEDGTVCRVVDYKTGKPKTRNVIEGKTASSDGSYKRQLVFYALLLSLEGNGQRMCNTGVLSFIEPDTKGVIHEESFTVTHEEIEDLKRIIIQASQEIVTGKFLQEPCDEVQSKYCHLARMLIERTSV